MTKNADLIRNLHKLNQITETLNQTRGIQKALNAALAITVELLGLKSGWIFIHDSMAQDRKWGKGFRLIAHYNLPAELDLEHFEGWRGSCTCQERCLNQDLEQAYNEIHCSRLSHITDSNQELAIHTTIPLRSGKQPLGIMNIAGAHWQELSAEELALLSNIGQQIGIFLERERLYELLQEQRIYEQIALLDLSRQLLGHTDLNELVDFVVLEIRRLLHADACALLLVTDDGNDLVFKAANGWRFDPVKDKRRVPNSETSGPGAVMRTQQPLLVQDLQDSRQATWTEAWVEREELRGHAVIPLVAEGRSIGTLMIDNREARLFDSSEVRFLQLMANQVALALENARLYHETIEHHRLEDELSVANKIQHSMLPDTCPNLPGWEFAATYKPARVVGGDFYDFYHYHSLPEQLGVVIADVTDKGIPAALFMVLCRTVLRTISLSGREPAKAIKRTNELILRDSKSDTFLSAFYARINSNNGEIVFACAGHNRPLWYQAQTGTIEELDAHGMVLGVMETAEYEQKSITPEADDVLVLYTDGVTDAINEHGEMFGVERLQASLTTAAGMNAEKILDEIMQAVEQFTTSAPQADDLTLVVIKKSEY